MNRLTLPIRNGVVMFATLVGFGLPSHAGQSLVCLIQPSKVAEIGTAVYGVIESISVERGDLVKKGQVIAVLRNDVERAALDVARSKAQADADVQAALANVEYTRQRLNRSVDLVEKKFISPQALEQSRVEFQVAEQKLAQAREQRLIWERERGLAQSQLSQRTLVSPIAGIVAERYLSTGERVENRSVARVVSISPLYVEAMVPVAHFGKIATGMTAAVTPELPGAQTVQATVSLVDHLVDGASNTFRVRLEVLNTDRAIPAGPRCKVNFGDQVVSLSATRASPPGPPPATATPAPAPVTAPPAVTNAVPPAPTFAKPIASAAAAVPQAVEAPTVEKQALDALESWRKAWESKDMAGYLTAYVADFLGGSPSREAWVRQRETRIRKPGELNIRLGEVKVQPVTDNQVRVQFRQEYQAGSYRDTTLKSLLLVLEKGRWLIREERSQP